MPLVACPKCAATLRTADGSTAAVRCPKCKTVFTPPAPAAAFEVVDESPPPPKPTPRPAPKPAPKPAEPEPEFEVLDDEPTPRKRRSRDDDDDDDDRPRSRRGRGRDRDDDDDDRPRGRGRRDRRRAWDDDDMHDRAVPFRRGKTACLLLSISIWLYMGAFGIVTLFRLLGWLGAGLSANLNVLPGLLGLGNWIVGLVGLGFAVAGPRQGKGLAIAATSVAGVHLVLLIVSFTNRQSLGDSFGIVGGGFGGLEWLTMVSMIPAVDGLLPQLVYGARGIGTDFIFEILAGGCEIARLILILLMFQAFARAARDGGAEDKAGTGVMVVSVVCGAVALVGTLVTVIVIEGKIVGSGLSLLNVANVLGYVAHTLMLILPGTAAVDVKDALDRRA